jgi:hypothetical protein
MQAGARFFKQSQLSLFLVILYCTLYLLMFGIVTMDKLNMVDEDKAEGDKDF